MMIHLIANPEGDGYVDFTYMAELNGKPVTDSNKAAYKLSGPPEESFRLSPGVYNYEIILSSYKDWAENETAHAWKVFAPIVRCIPAWGTTKSTLQQAIDEAGELSRVVIADGDDDE